MTALLEEIEFKLTQNVFASDDDDLGEDFDGDEDGDLDLDDDADLGDIDDFDDEE